MTNSIGLKKWIGIWGGATRYSEKQIIAAYRIGEELARKGKNLVTGGTTGIHHAAALGAKKEGALVIGISPASSLEEHVERYKKPLDCLDCTDFIIYTGMGFDGRNLLISRSTIGTIFIGGEFGTLNGFSSAWMCGNNVLGVLQGVGGISDYLQYTLNKIQTSWGSQVIFDSDPVGLMDQVCKAVDQTYATRISKLQFEEIGKDVRDLIGEYSRKEEGKSG